MKPICLNRFYLAGLLRMFVFSIAAISLTSAQAGWTGFGEVSDVYSHNGYHVIQTTISDNNCGTAGKFWWANTDTDANDMFSIVLAAMLSGKNIRVHYSDSSTQCNWGGELATHMNITN